MQAAPSVALQNTVSDIQDKYKDIKMLERVREKKIYLKNKS